MLLSAFIKASAEALGGLYPQGEAAAMVRILCKERLGVESWTHVANPEYVIDEASSVRLEADMARLLKAEPLQYVLGRTEFCGRSFKVDPRVLIPRPETEGLAGIALEHLRASGPGAKALDLCTGSGCIAWTLALECPGAEVTGVDVSRDALALASAQFEGEPRPRFVEADVLDADGFPLAGPFDLMVSNPPYIRRSEKAAMRPNVLDYEPGLALFVPDRDPLLFYRAIRGIATRSLAPGGLLACEINEALGPETLALFDTSGFGGAEIRCDFCGKKRYLLAKRHPLR